MNVKKAATYLKIAFMLGAVTDAAALIPMLFRPAARLLWGLDDPTGGYAFAMGYGAALMLAWTVLLVWAFLKPLERRAVAPFTVLIVVCFVAVEAISIANGTVLLSRMVPSFVMQGILTAVFTFGYAVALKQAAKKE